MKDAKEAIDELGSTVDKLTKNMDITAMICSFGSSETLLAICRLCNIQISLYKNNVGDSVRQRCFYFLYM